uniref:Transposon-derived Buster3 transposase-like protein n=1 Tax=Sipha flava TaxID=143950 RepID=A0A2S2Q8J9_9HEMI
MFFDNNIKRRIDLMSENILKQLIHQVISAKTFSIQINEFVDVKNNVQPIMLIYLGSPDDYFEEFLFYKPLSIITKGLDIFKKLNFFSGKIYILLLLLIS